MPEMTPQIFKWIHQKHKRFFFSNKKHNIFFSNKKIHSLYRKGYNFFVEVTFQLP